MEISCDKCGKKYKVDDNKIVGKTARFKCKSCENVIVVTGPDPVETFEDIPSQPEPQVSYTPPSQEAPAPRTGKADDKGTRLKIKWTDSIQVRMNIIFVLLIVFIFAGFTLFRYYETKEVMNKELSQFSQLTVNKLATALVEPLWNLDERLIDSAIDSEMREKQIYAILVKDSDGKTVLRGKRRDKNWKIVESKAPVRGNFTSKTKRIVKDKETIGFVDVFVTSSFMQEEFNRSVINLAWTAIILIVAIVFATFILFRILLIRPIAQLTYVADRMSLGDLNVEVAVKSRNEIGLLATAIERMQASLRLAMDRLRQRH